MEGNEEKAIALYLSKEGTRLPLERPFPTKKNDSVQDTPVHLAAKYALGNLLSIFFEYGGNPSYLNNREETSLHSTCLLASYPLKRAELISAILDWELVRPSDNVIEKVDINAVDIDGNTALHLSAFNGMVQCIEILIKKGARLSIINNYNRSCCESADRGGFPPVGTMLELAWIFQPSSELQQATQVYNKFSNEMTSGSIIIDCKSIALTGLIDFINHAIRITAETLNETAARAEVLLSSYCWDVKKLKKEYLQNNEKVLKATKLKPRSNALKKALGGVASSVLSDREVDTIRVGLPVEDIFCDPSYLKVSQFSVYKDGARKSYSLQIFDGKVCVFPTGFDPSLRYMDDPGALSSSATGGASSGSAVSASATSGSGAQASINTSISHIKPKKTEPCQMCGEMMLEPASIIHFISGNIVEPFKREIRCSSGHKFCFSCWSDHTQAHHSLGCLPCPAVDCGEILDLQWAPMVLKRSELVNRLLTCRQQAVIKNLDLKLCPAPNCGLLLRILPHAVNKANRYGNHGSARVVICSNGHSFCLTCSHEAHSPLQCSELSAWQDLLRQESKGPSPVVSKGDKGNDKTKGTINNSMFVSPPTTKSCPDCEFVINKDEACNIVNCANCGKKLCWICMRDWSSHSEGMSAVSLFLTLLLLLLPSFPLFLVPCSLFPSLFCLSIGNGSLYCNQFIEKIPKNLHHLSSAYHNTSNNSNETTGEEKMLEDIPVLQKKQKMQRGAKILHHFNRYMSHIQSQKLEHQARKNNCNRILDGLRASQEGELVWLRGNTSSNPLFEQVEDDYQFPTIGLKEDALIADYQVPIEEAIEFISDAFDELEKSRTLLKWSYPFALFEFDEKISKGKKLSPNRHLPQRLESFKVDFGLLQASLEYNTEILSNYVGRKRLRGTKQEICIASITVRHKRIELEQLIQDYVTPQAVLDEIQYSQLASEEMKMKEIALDSVSSGNGATPSSPSNANVNMTLTNTGPNLNGNNGTGKSVLRAGSNLSLLSNLTQQQQQQNQAPSLAENHQQPFSTPSPSQHANVSSPSPAVTPASGFLGGNTALPIRSPATPMNPTMNASPGTMTMIPEPLEVISIEQRIIAPKKDPDEEALEHAILLSKQEEEYGVNMYDSLTPSDEPVIAEYVDQGFTREEAILIIYEEKYGKVSIQAKDITPSLPSTMKSGGYHPIQDDPEVKNLMTKGYTKEQAIEIVMKKKNNRRSTPVRTGGTGSSAVNSPSNLAVMSEEEGIRSLIACGYSHEQAITMYHEARRGESLHVSSASAMDNDLPISDPAIAVWIARGYNREQAIQQASLEQQRRLSQGRSAGGMMTSPPHHQLPMGGGINRMSSYDEDEIAAMIARGFTREQAMQFTHRKFNSTSHDTHERVSFALLFDFVSFLISSVCFLFCFFFFLSLLVQVQIMVDLMLN
jgi:hypothetical protein